MDIIFTPEFWLVLGWGAFLAWLTWLGRAGYNKENVLVEVKDGILTVEGKVDNKNVDYIKQGLAFRQFFKQFELAKDVIIDEAEMKDGLLKIKFGYNEPKEIEGFKINIK